MFLSFLKEHKYLLAHTVIAVIVIWLVAYDRLGFGDNDITNHVMKSILLAFWMAQFALAIMTLAWHEASLKKGLNHIYIHSAKECLNGIATVFFASLAFMTFFGVFTAVFLGFSLMLMAILTAVAILTRESMTQRQEVLT